MKFVSINHEAWYVNARNQRPQDRDLAERAAGMHGDPDDIRSQDLDRTD